MSYGPHQDWHFLPWWLQGTLRLQGLIQWLLRRQLHSSWLSSHSLSHWRLQRPWKMTRASQVSVSAWSRSYEPWLEWPSQLHRSIRNCWPWTSKPCSFAISRAGFVLMKRGHCPWRGACRGRRSSWALQGHSNLAGQAPGPPSGPSSFDCLNRF